MQKLIKAALAGTVMALSLASVASAQDKTVITMWDQFFSDAPNKLMDNFVSEYEKAHPDIEIKRNVLDTDSIRNTLPTALAADKGPDIFYYDAGPEFLGRLVSAGLVADLTQAYKERGWDQSLVAWPVGRVTYDGKIWGVPNEIEYTNVYFNKALVHQFGLDDKIVPAKDDSHLLTLSSLDDFKAILDAAKKAGVTPIAFGNRDPGRGGHLFSYFLTLNASKAFVDNILFGDGTWDDPKVVAAWQMYKDFADAGYYPPTPNAISFDEANALFFNDSAATDITGTWLIGDVMEQAADPSQIDFLMLPPADDSLPLSAAGGIGSAFAISAKSPNKAAALDFLDFLMSKDSARHWLEDASIIPPVKGIDAASLKLSPMLQRAVAGASLPLGYNLDVVMPAAWNQAMKDGTQAILNNTATPAQVAANMQKAWEAAKAKGEIWKAQ